MYVRAGAGFLLVLAIAQSLSAQILPPGATPTRLVTGYGFTEGPLYDRTNHAVYFTDLGRSDIVRYSVSAGTAQIVDPNSGAANGLFYDREGHIISMDRDRRQVSRRSLANVAVVDAVLADDWNGSLFNGPNDLVIDQAGGIYFSDPDYENRQSLPEAVYYLDTLGTVTRLLTGFQRPNGLALSPDGSILYLAVEAQKKIMAYDVGPNGTLSNQRQFALTNVDANGNPLAGINNGPDGLTVDPAGNLYAAVQRAVFAWNPAGQRIMDLNMPSLPVVGREDPTNVEFGGLDGRTLYITAATSLYSIGLNVLPTVPGDFDEDADIDAHDIDALWHMVRGSGADPGNNDSADLDHDGSVDEQDVDHLVDNVLGSLYGDADLDDDVDGADFDAWRIRDSLGGVVGWATGDFDGDGDVDGADFDLWRLRPTTYGAGGSFAPVPEPATALLLALAAPALIKARRSRSTASSDLRRPRHADRLDHPDS